MVNANLTRRIAAAIVLVPAVLAAVLWLPSAYFAAAAALFVAVGSWEWAGLSAGSTPGRRLTYAAVTLFVMLSLFLLAPSPGALLLPCALGVVWWARGSALGRRGATRPPCDNARDRRGCIASAVGWCWCRPSVPWF